MARRFNDLMVVQCTGSFSGLLIVRIQADS